MLSQYSMESNIKFYHKVFDLLVSIGGAIESMRDDFIFHHATSETPCDEYRFQGSLGFGGKYWLKTNRVNCYREDESPERVAIIKQLNDELAKLVDRTTWKE